FKKREGFMEMENKTYKIEFKHQNTDEVFTQTDTENKETEYTSLRKVNIEIERLKKIDNSVKFRFVKIINYKGDWR
ncbi:MAG: hypothetical protein Q7R95_05875, partial [bacterium]|nr:hypothetical protein [bacterium]